MSAITSSAIELYPHQLNVSSLVLHDHRLRYLLADEVGLGKTIEAGIIIRQFVLDNLHSRKLLIIVPRSIEQQWIRELREKFFLGDFIDDELISIVSSCKYEQIKKKLTEVHFLIIDEVHHICTPEQDDLYKIVSSFSEEIDKAVLLLSATPIINNEASFSKCFTF